MVKPEAGLHWTRSSAYVLADPNRYNTRLMDQWIGIGSAGSVAGVKEALDRIVGLPWVNTIAVDRNGNTLYADASVVPLVNADLFASDCLVIPALLTFDGARAKCGWGSDARRAGRHPGAGQRAVGDAHGLCRQFQRQLLAQQSPRLVDGARTVRLFSALRQDARGAKAAQPHRFYPTGRGAGSASRSCGWTMCRRCCTPTGYMPPSWSCRNFCRTALT